MKCCVYTLGCKVNQYESEAIANKLQEMGFSVVLGLELADIYIVNSCAVTNEAEHKSVQVITKINKLNPNAKIYVCGCSSQLDAQKFLSKKNVVAVIGTENKIKLVQAIANNLQGDLTEKISNIYNNNYCSIASKKRTFIKIQDGCNNFCSYCIIPYVRGRERSRSVEQIKQEIDLLKDKIKEVVLVGINMAGYGKDLQPKQTLVDVVKLFNSRYPDLRLRFSSVEMGTITEELLQELVKNNNFCPFFHLSLQSASDNVLKAMNRKYTFSQYLDSVNLIKKYFKYAHISTDIIVGFPTETEEDFNNCLTNVKKVDFGNVHIFPYSSKKGTVAGSLKQINGDIIKQRINKLKLITDEKKQQFINYNLNQNEQVMMEEQEDGYFVGFTKNYIRCYIKSGSDITNTVVNCILVKPFKNGVLGKII